MADTKKKKKYFWSATICGIAILFASALIIIILTSSKETNVSIKKDQSTLDILDCVSSSPEDPFFTHSTEIDAEHRVKTKYQNETFDGFNFTYTGTYQSTEAAEEALSWMHADYNKYIAGVDIYQEDLYPTFSAMDSKAIINLSLPKKYLNSGTAKFVFIDNEEFINLGNMTIQDLQKLYESKGFSCKTTN